MFFTRLLERKAVAVVPAGLVALISATAFLGLLWIFLDPHWETNDDVAMSMVAHGYGSAAYGSPYLIFSNVLWGHVVRSIPAFGGLLGYSLGTMAALWMAGAAIVFFLLRLNVSIIIAVSAMALVLLQPASAPQFTISAGLLSAAAVLGILAYARHDCIFSLVAAGGLIFTGFLIRNLEVALVLAVAMPLLPWCKLKLRSTWLAGGGLLIVLVLATFYDIAAYRGEAWVSFWDLQYARAPFTDFGAANRVLERPDIMKKYGLSQNDILLIGNWFLTDRELANPAVLNAVLKDASFISTSTFNLSTARAALRNLTDPKLIAIVAAAIGLMLLALRTRLIGAAMIAVGLIFVIGGAGRPDVTRVFVPIVSMVVLLGVVSIDPKNIRRHVLAVIILSFGFAGSAWMIWPVVQEAQLSIKQARENRYKTATPVVVWGGVFPFQTAFPPFTKATDVIGTAMIGLGGFTQAPFAVARQLDLAGNGMIKQLLSPSGVPIYATAGHFEKLGIYCAERHSGTLEVHVVSTSMYGTLRQAKCSATR